MKVLYVGNPANTPYICAKRLRNRGHDSGLLFLYRHITNHPLWVEVDTELSEDGVGVDHGAGAWTDDQRRRLPDWVTAVEIDSDVDPLKKPSIHYGMIRRIRDRDCDVIHAWNIYSAIWSSFSGKPYIYYITGQYDWQRDRKVNSTLFKFPLKVLVGRAISNATVVVGPSNLVSDLESRYGDANTHVLMPIVETELFHPSGERSKHDGLELFAGARHHWEFKRNDVMFQALAELDRDDVHLTTIAWGSDVDRSKELVAELGIEESVTFAPLMSKPRLSRTIRESDAVLDQFQYGFGSLARQTLACGTPLISEIDPDRWEEPPPIMRASTVEDVTRRLEQVETEGDEWGTRSFEWIERNYDQDAMTRRYIDIYEQVVESET